MQIIVFHNFAYTCCTASFQSFCGMSAIRYNVLNDSGFPHGCYRTLVECKGSVFLGISAVCGGIFLIFLEKCAGIGDFRLKKCCSLYIVRYKKCIYVCLFAWKNVFLRLKEQAHHAKKKNRNIFSRLEKVRG